MGIFNFLKNVSREMGKVTWPKGKELWGYTTTVVVTVLLVAVFFALVDFGISKGLNIFFE